MIYDNGIVGDNTKGEKKQNNSNNNNVATEIFVR